MAREFLENQKLKISHNLDRDGIAYPSTYCHQKMIEFAQLHTEAALKAASESKTYGMLVIPLFNEEQKSSILNAYPKENIL